MHGENAPVETPQTQLTETPSSRQLGGPAGVFANTTEARKVLRQQLVKIKVVKFLKFLDLILPWPTTTPPLPPVAQVLRVLGRNGTLVKTGRFEPGNNVPIWRWSVFDREPAAMDGVKEVTVFGRMVNIVDAIKNAVTSKQGPSPTMSYMDEPNKPPIFSTRSNYSRPDGYFYFDPSGKLPHAQARHWHNIGVVAEFKKKEGPSELHDDFNKMLWSLNHVMRDDPCRRFSLGFTIENRSMRLWYCDRSQIIVTNSFGFIEWPIAVIDTFMRIMYASKTTLGCDSTMQLVDPTDAVPRYTLSIHTIDPASNEIIERQYITDKIISDAGADGIVSRGTRVWSATEIGGDERSCIVKDYWVDYDRDPEGDIITRVKEAFPQGTPQHATLHRHLLTVLAHGKVPRSIDSLTEADTTLDLPSDAYIDKKFYWIELVGRIMDMARSSDLHERTPHGPTSYVNPYNHPHYEHGRRSHCRIAFAETGEPLHRCTSLRDVFSALCDVAKCLTALHEAGWVHRDISTGNILLVQEGNTVRGILADFEYAKHRDDTRKVHEVRTGTPYYMSVEVDDRDYQWLSACPPPLSCNYDQRPPQTDYPGEEERLFGPSSVASFRYHPLNDWESFWWVGASFVIDREVKQVKTNREVKPQSPKEREDQIKFARELFYSKAERMKILSKVTDNVFRDRLRCVHPAVRQIACRCLEDMRQTLIGAYANAERGGPPTFEKSRLAFPALFPTQLNYIKEILDRADVEVGHFEVDWPEVNPDGPSAGDDRDLYEKYGEAIQDMDSDSSTASE